MTTVIEYIDVKENGKIVTKFKNIYKTDSIVVIEPIKDLGPLKYKQNAIVLKHNPFLENK